MQTVKNKLNNKQGASITIALLLFLVCAAVSAVVIVAGTMAAGRLSGMSESEERYYSVTSAAKLIQSQLDEETAEIITAGGKTYLMTSDVTGDPELCELTDDFAKSSIRTFPNYAACMIVKQTAFLGGLTMTADAAAADLKTAAEDISITPQMEPGDRISFTVQNIEGDKYTIKLLFDVNSKQIPVDLSAGGSSASGTRTIYSFSLADASVQ